MEKTRVELAEAENSLLPKLDAVVLASQDVGAPATSKRDKSPFELEAGIYGEVPLQRRAAQGKIEAARGKLSQLQAKREFVANKVVAEVQDAVSALRAAEARIIRSRSNLELAEQTLTLGREQFEAGDIDVQLLNLYEQAATDAQFKLISAEADYFIAVADYNAALARNPLDVSQIEQP
jgi:outer membrane protein TolC